MQNSHGIFANSSKLDYFSVSGDVAVWDFPYCIDKCREHTTFLPFPVFHWPLRQGFMSYYLDIYVRGFHSAYVFFTRDPYHDFPRITVMVNMPDNVTKIRYEPTKSSSEVLALFSDLKIDYWVWTQLQFKISDKLVIGRTVKGHFEKLLTVNHTLITFLRWFSIGSHKSICHWTLFCEPENNNKHVYLPECLIDTPKIYYNGTQWVTAAGTYCIIII